MLQKRSEVQRCVFATKGVRNSTQPACSCRGMVRFTSSCGPGS